MVDFINAVSLLVRQSPASPGARQKTRQVPAVSRKAMMKPIRAVRFWNRSRRRTTSAKANIASRGMVNSSMTSADETVRNLL